MVVELVGVDNVGDEMEKVFGLVSVEYELEVGCHGRPIEAVAVSPHLSPVRVVLL